MTTADEEFAREFARMSAAFVAQLPQQVQALNDDLAAWLSEPRDARLFESLSHKLHQLKGSGSTFGCRGISESAEALERRLTALPTDASSGRASALVEIEAALEALRGETSRVCGESAQGSQPGAWT